MKHSKSEPFHRRIIPPLAGAVWVLGCGLVDWKTGPELALSAFYLPGIILAAWFSGRTTSVWIAIMAAVVWLQAELVWKTPYSHPFIPVWNGLIRLSIFTLTALLTSEIRVRQQTESALRNQTEILSAILNSMRDGVVVLDGNMNILLSNPAAHKLFGRIPLSQVVNEWIERSEGLLQSPPCVEAENQAFLLRVMSIQRADHGEISFHTDPSEPPINLGIVADPLMGHDGKQAAVLLVLHDMTARRNLERQISQASEHEQRRIGQDLHDGICQHLAGVAFAASTLQNELELMELPPQASAAGEIAHLVREGINQARNLARGLYPTGIEEGLQVALGSLASTTRKQVQVECDFTQSGDDPSLSRTSAGHLYRIAQEAVANAVRHSQSPQIRIQLDHQKDFLVLEVADDGGGIGSARAEERGIGLQIMKYRANLIGAKLEILSQEGGGTRIRCKMMLPEHLA